MKIAIAKEHRDFYQKQGLIEFEDFLTSDQVDQFNNLINQALATRLAITEHQVSRLNAEQLFLAGRDLWRSSAELKKLIVQPRYAQIASDLIDKKPLRLGYDQLFPACNYLNAITNDPSQVYNHFLQQSATLNQVSSIEGLLCGFVLCLSKPKDTEEAQPLVEEGIDIFPKTPGHAIYFSPEALINLRGLFQHSNQRYLLIVYTQATSFYKPQAQDPMTHNLKQFEYMINDKLNDKLHPVVYR